MALRLLPAFTDDDDNDDGNFTKWMSSYWGHGAEGGHARDRKHSFRRAAGTRGDRRASLPTVSQLDAMKLNRIHAAAMAPSPSHMKAREEMMEVRNHQRAHRSSSDDNSRSKSGILENRISTIPELTESFERRLFLQDERTTSLASRRSERGRPPHGEASACQVRRLSDERRKSADGPLCLETEQHTQRRQLSLRRHRCVEMEDSHR
ncbi:leukemia NUP98 fusion partner 1 [Anarhichas minor]|uniref:leukemia NUP98 fusion partner 1 n=1 Tax=Anarhichas minor TaxID=65739 RepID=UPI003F737235